MKTLTIDGRLKVKTLKDNFKEAFGGTLRVYNGNKKTDDDATLASIRTNDTASGEVECTENMTVGEFETELAEKFGIKVQVASPDDWVLALDEYTLSTVCDIPKNATKAKMQELLDEQYAADEAEIGDVAPAENASEYVPAKKSAISGEYIITVKANNSVEVFRIYDNVRGSLREAADAAGFKYDPDWNTRRFGLMFVKAYGQGPTKPPSASTPLRCARQELSRLTAFIPIRKELCVKSQGKSVSTTTSHGIHSNSAANWLTILTRTSKSKQVVSFYGCEVTRLQGW